MEEKYELVCNLITELIVKLEDETILEKNSCINFMYKLLDILDILKDEKNEEEITAILYSLKKATEDMNNFDVEILNLLSKYNNCYIESLKGKLDNIASELESDVALLNDNIVSRKEYMDALNETMKNKSLCSKELKTRIISICLALGIYGTVWLSIANNSKRMSTGKVYCGVITTYFSLDNSIKEENTYFDLNSDDNTYINIYSKVFKDGLFGLKKNRIVSSYDVSDYCYNDIEDYLDIDLSNFTYSVKQIEYSSGTSYEQYSEVIKTDVDKNKVIMKVNKLLYYYIQIYCVLFIEMILIMISSHIIKEKRDKQRFYNYNQIFLGILLNLKSLLRKNSNKQNLFLQNKSFEEDILKLIDDINEVDVDKHNLILRFEKNLLEFYQLYQRYGKIIDSSQELLDRVEVIQTNSHVKKLVRSKDN